jgi:hypothetical protein
MMHASLFLFLRHHSNYTYGFYATNLFAWGLAVLEYNAQQIYFLFLCRNKM